MIEVIAASAIHRIRGGGIIPLGGRCDDVAALLFGLLCWYVTSNPWAILVMGAAYRLAESFQWGHWVGVAIGADFVQRNSWLDVLLRDLEDRRNLWAAVGLTLRGFLFGVIMMLGMMFFDHVVAMQLMIVSMFMAPAYFVTRLAKISPGHRWALGEYIYGAMLGAALL